MAAEKQTTNSDVRDMLCEILRTQSEMMNKLDVLSKEVTHLTHRMSHVEKSVESIENVNHSMTANLAYVNSLNVMFYGAYLKPGMPLNASFRNFMIEFLHANPEKIQNMAFHVQFMPKMSQEDDHHPICVTFRSPSDRDYVMHKASKHADSLRRVRIWAGGRKDVNMVTWRS